jgi:hypothetical protein
MPGTYAVRVSVPGIAKPLTGTVLVDADPLPHFSATDRAARQAILMSIYDWTRALGEGHAAARALINQRDSITADLTANGGSKARGDSLNARVAELAGDIDRAMQAVNAQRGSIEGWSGLPTVDQRKAVGYAIDDGQKALTALNALITTEIPAAYRQVAKKEWTRKVGTVRLPARVP